MKRPRAAAVTLKLTVVTLVVGSVFLMTGTTALAASPVPLGTVSHFAILSYAGVTNVPTSSITGDVGVSPTTGASITDPTLCAQMPTYTIYTVDNVSGTLACSVQNAGLLTTAMNDLGTAYTNAANRLCPPGHVLTGTNLGGLTLTDGVYCFSSSAGLTGTLTLNCEGVADAVFIFQIGSQLTTAVGNGTVSLINCPGGSNCNVFWQVSTLAALGGGSTFIGTIMAGAAVTVGSGETIIGRLLALTENVTLIRDTITRPTCQTPTTTTTTSATTTTTTGTATTTTTGTATTTTTGTATTTTTGTATTTTTSGTGSATTTTGTTATTTPTATPTPFNGAAANELPGPGPNGPIFASLGIAFVSAGLVLFALAPSARRRRAGRSTGR